jgi:hypothetical protein
MLVLCRCAVSAYRILWQRVRMQLCVDDSESDENCRCEPPKDSVLAHAEAGVGIPVAVGGETPFDKARKKVEKVDAEAGRRAAYLEEQGVESFSLLVSLDRVRDNMKRYSIEPIRSTRNAQLLSDDRFASMSQSLRQQMDTIPKSENFGKPGYLLHYVIPKLRPGAYYRIGVSAKNDLGYSDTAWFKSPVRVKGTAERVM